MESERAKALKWWRAMSINQQNALMDKHFLGRSRDLVCQTWTLIVEMYTKENQSMYAQFEGFEIEMTKDDAVCMAHQGDCEADVVYYLQTNESIQKQLTEIGNENIAEELKGYGAWDEKELQDVEANKRRIVWLAANSIKEEN